MNEGLAAFVGFSWGPPRDAFEEATRSVPAEPGVAQGLQTQASSLSLFDTAGESMSFNPSVQTSTPHPHGNAHPFITPMRPSHSRHAAAAAVPPSTIRVTASARRQRAPGSGSATRPGVSDREAMKVLVGCVGMSARKKVMESGKRPRVLDGLMRLSCRPGSTGQATRESPIGPSKISSPRRRDWRSFRLTAQRG